MSHTDLDRPEPPTAVDALNAIGLTGESLMRIARRVANDFQRRTGTRLGDRYDDLVSSLHEAGLRAALKYDPAKANGEQGISWVWKLMDRRCEDFMRRKSEGFGDRRSGSDNRIVLTADHEDFDTDYDFDGLLRERRMGEWQKAADQAGLPVEQWLMHVADKAAARQLGLAA